MESQPAEITQLFFGQTLRETSNYWRIPTFQESYLSFDWEVLESIDNHASTEIVGGQEKVGAYFWPGVVFGDAGRAKFHTTLGAGEDYSLKFTIAGGGGKVAIDNVRVTEGGAGPWRRDFENGFVLVNPINRPYTFSAKELAGQLNRTEISRILGTQAPEVNNGQPVSNTLTLQPFDAIILLAGHLPLER